MKYPTAALGDVAPAKPIKINGYSKNDVIWQITLDHIESDTGQLLEKSIKPISEAGTSTHGFDGRHVLYSKLRPYLNKVLLPDEIGLGTTELVPMLPDPKLLDRNYLAHYLKSKTFVNWVSSQTAGAKMPRVSMQVFWEHQIPLPPLSEQKRIAAILDKADAIRRKRQQAIQLADDFLRAVFLDMFGDPVTNPKGWEIKTLGELIKSGPSNGLYKHANDYGEGIRILRIDGFYNGALSVQSNMKRVRLNDQELMKYKLQDRSIVINRVNSREYLGKSAFISGLEEPTVFESNMMNFGVDESRINPRFLVEQLQTPFIKNQILMSAKDAVNQSSINQQDVKALNIIVPDLVLQHKFEAICYKYMVSKKGFQNSQFESDKLFYSLSQKAFAGEL